MNYLLLFFLLLLSYFYWQSNRNVYLRQLLLLLLSYFYWQSTQEHLFTTTADPASLQGKQLATYNLIKHHFESTDPNPLRMIISGIAGTGNHI